jgi:hypothetical protein
MVQAADGSLGYSLWVNDKLRAFRANSRFRFREIESLSKDLPYAIQMYSSSPVFAVVVEKIDVNARIMAFD